MTDLTFSLETAQELFESGEEFPVNFNFAWQWLGYSTKGNAKKLLDKNFEKEVDFCLIQSDEPTGFGDSEDLILLTTDCLKEMGMLAKTEKGREVRKYFIQCEKLAKQFIQNHKDLIIAAQLSNKMTVDYQELKKLSTFYANEFVEKLGIKHITVDQTPDLNASLVANRLGLAFNKQIKAFEAIQDATSPEAFNDLRKAYYQLAEQFSELLLVKTAPPTVEYVDKIKVEYVDNPHQAVQIEQLKAEVEMLKTQITSDSGVILYPQKMKSRRINPS
jgi:phage anti-repressor protein